jgi:dTDP-4-amino-4,6-dideoxygalactose transaminase
MRKIEFFRHNVEGSDIQRVENVLRGLFLTTGSYTKDFEEEFAHYVGAKHVIGVTSCTAALHLSLLGYGIGQGDEVITTPLSFIATANVVEYCGAKPVFVDVEDATGNIDASKIEAAITPKTKAILPVHLYGQMCDMKKIREIADKHKLRVIEDAAHAIESEREGYKVGQLGDCACYSFYATKNITSGEGGAVSTNDANLEEFLRKGRLHGMSKNAADRYEKKYEHYDMEFCGWKYNMSNIQAALLIGQLERIEDILEAKKKVVERYDAAFSENKNITLMQTLPNVKHAHHLYTIQVDAPKRDRVLHELQEKGIGVAVNFRPIHLMKYYAEKYGFKAGMFPVTEKIGASTITLPLYAKLSDDEVKYVTESVLEVLG